MSKNTKRSLFTDLNQQGANALLSATFAFLARNNISEQMLVKFARGYNNKRPARSNSKLYDELLRAYESMGVIMATWFSDPRFLNASGNPLPLSVRNGPISLARLVRASHAKVETSMALRLMKQSPSIRFDKEGSLSALRRVFVLPEVEVPRAAFVVERYLGTLQRNASARKRPGTLLLERSCHVSELNLASVAPMLRDIESRGTAFMDSIDGEIEGQRLRRVRRPSIGELGVLVFAWTRPVKNSGGKKKLPFSKPARKSHSKRTNDLTESDSPND